MKNIDLKIKKLLESKEISASRFCKKIGVTESGYTYMIKNESMKLKTLYKISEVLQVPVSYFFDESEVSNVGSGPDVSLQVLKKENEGLKKEIELKNEIIELLKNK